MRFHFRCHLLRKQVSLSKSGQFFGPSATYLAEASGYAMMGQLPTTAHGLRALGGRAPTGGRLGLQRLEPSRGPDTPPGRGDSAGSAATWGDGDADSSAVHPTTGWESNCHAVSSFPRRMSSGDMHYSMHYKALKSLTRSSQAS